MFWKKFEIRFSETDESGCLSMSGLLRLFQDVGYFHALARGRGNTPVRTSSGTVPAPAENQKRTWYLLSWHIEAMRMPVCGEAVTAGTWIYFSGGSIAKKQLLLRSADGEILAVGDTRWVYMDVLTGQPAIPPEGVWLPEDFGERLPLAEKVERLRPRRPTDAETVALPHDCVDARLLDINHHANNVLFTEYAMTLASMRTGCRFLAAEFLRQAKAGAELCPYLSSDGEGKTVTVTDGEGTPYAVFRFA